MVIYRGQEVDCYATLVRSPGPGMGKPLWRYERIEIKMAAEIESGQGESLCDGVICFPLFRGQSYPAGCRHGTTRSI